MQPNFNINRPKVSDEEIKQHQDFEGLVKQFKEQSLKKARGDESWWRNKKIQYSTLIAGLTVVCTITYLSIKNTTKQTKNTHETLITQKKEQKTPLTKQAFINAPSGKLKVNYSNYKINSSKENNITHSTGSKIKVPKNAFVNKHGADITGDVTIEYREFHDYADIIVSGIPMTYDSAGKSYNFESAGMFDIKGSQNGEPVFIKPGKNLSVELASNKNENKFNQYYLDTLKRIWQYLKHDQVIGNPKQATVASQQPPANNKKTDELRNRIDVIIPQRLDSVKTVYVKKIDKLPLAVKPGKPSKLEKGKPSFKIDGSHDEFPELSAFENVVFEVGPENKNYSKELHDITWSDVKISQGPDKGKNYLLTLSYRQRKEQLIVYPVLSGADYEKAEKLYETKLAQYEIKKEKRLADEKRLLDEMALKQAQFLEEQRKLEAAYKKEQDLIRANYNLAAKQALAKDFGNLNNQTKTSRLFEVSQFGVYNSDCARPTPEGNEVVPIFVYNNKPILAQTVYFIDYTSKVVIALNRENGYKFSYAQNQAYSLCVFDKNNLYLCNKTNFDLTTQTQGNHFELSLETRAAEDLNELKKALDI